jgi:glycosyltransferase involved in cell wall biosynthesis
MSDPLLSIVTPVLDGKRFIESCIQSVIEQGCTRLEHCIIDGGSKDGTVQIGEHYAQKYPHIRWISQKDKGQSDAMNKGILQARGRYIGFVNADDYYEPNVLNDVIELLEMLPEPGILVGNCRVLDGEGRLLYINKPRPQIINILLGSQFPVNPSAYFYHRSLHDKIGIYDTDDHYCMDLDFLFRAIRKAHVKYVDRIFGNFRLMEGTKTFRLITENRLKDSIERIFANYCQMLPWPLRMYVSCVRGLRHFYFRSIL